MDIGRLSCDIKENKMDCFKNIFGRGTRRSRVRQHPPVQGQGDNGVISPQRPTIIRSGLNSEISQLPSTHQPLQGPSLSHDYNHGSPRYANEDIWENTETSLESLLQQLKQRIDEQTEKYTVALAKYPSDASSHPSMNLKQFHSQQKQLIVADFQTSYKTAFQSPSWSTVVKQAAEVLTARMDSEFANFHNPAGDDGLRNYVLQFSKSSVQIYVDCMRQGNGSPTNMERNHTAAQNEAMNYYHRYFCLFGLNITDDWKHGLLQQIDAKYQELKASQLHQRGQIQAPLHPSNKSSSINIGIYLSESTISIATINQESESNVLVEEIPAEISFLKKEIKIGKQTSGDDTSFKLLALIRSPSSTNSVKVGSQSFNLTTEEILGAFFIRVRVIIAKITGLEINKAVLTASFFLSALEKERMKYALKISGFHKFRIITSVLTTAVAYAHEIQHYQNNGGTNSILVIHPTSRSFSMAMIELHPNQIVSVSSIGPENIPQYEGNFRHCHNKLYNSQVLSVEQIDYLKMMYDQALGRLFQDTQIHTSHIVMVNDRKEIPQLQKFVNSFFSGNIINKLVHDGPLSGAAIVASEFPIFPSQLNIYDSSRSDLLVSCGTTPIGGFKAFKNSRFVPGEVLSIPVAIPLEGIDLNFQELIRDSACLEVGRYYLKPRNYSITKAQLVVNVDEDGVFAVHANFPNGLNDGFMKRIYGIQSGDSQLGLKSLFIYYEKGDNAKEGIYSNLPPINITEEGNNSEIRTRNFPVQPETSKTTGNIPYSISPDMLTLIKQKSLSAVQDGLKKYKLKMTELTDRKEPLKDSDIKNFHDKVKTQVLLAFTSTFEKVFSTAPATHEALQYALTKLEAEMLALLPVFMKRHEIVIGRVTAKTTLVMLEAENKFEDKMTEATDPNVPGGGEVSQDSVLKEAEEWLKQKLEEEAPQEQKNTMKSLGLRSKKSKSKRQDQQERLNQPVVLNLNTEAVPYPQFNYNNGGQHIVMPAASRTVQQNNVPSPSAASKPITPEDTFRQMKLSIQNDLKKYQEALADFILMQGESVDMNYDEFHENQKKLLLTAFHSENHVYFESSNEQVFNTALQAHSVLEVQLDSHFASYVKPSEKDGIVKMYFVRFADDALNYYRQNMSKVDKDFETSEETKIRHEEEKQNAIQYLETHFKLYGWDITTDWKNGLIKKIEEEFRSHNTPVPSAPQQTPTPSFTFRTPVPSAPPATETLLRRLDIPSRISNPQPNAISSINIGLYLDEISITASVFSNSQHRVLIQEMPAQIVFTDKEMAIGGSVSQVTPRNYFSIYAIIKQISYMHFISMRSKSLKISSEEVLAAFFQQLFVRIKSSAGVQNVTKVVLSVPFLLTGLEKERLKHSLKLAGVYNTRILSSLVTTAVSYAHQTNYYPHKSAETKTILAIQYGERSFSSSIIEIKAESIIAKSVTGSENVVGNDGTFWHCHKFMFNNNPRLKVEQSNFVTTTYRTALQRLYADAALPKQPDQIILIKKHRQQTLLDDMVTSLFAAEIRVHYINEGPLAGASLLASAEIPASVSDASRSDLLLTSNESSTSTVIPFHNSAFTPREIFPASMTVPPQGFELVVKEEFCKDKLRALVGVYRLVPQNSGIEGKAKYSFIMDQDGIFTVVSDVPDGVIKKTFGMEGECDVGLPSWRELNSFYGSVKISNLPSALKDLMPQNSNSKNQTNRLPENSSGSKPTQQPLALTAYPYDQRTPNPISASELLTNKSRASNGQDIPKMKAFPDLEQPDLNSGIATNLNQPIIKQRIGVPVFPEAIQKNNVALLRNNLRPVNPNSRTIDHANLTVVTKTNHKEFSASRTISPDQLEVVKKMIAISAKEGVQHYKATMVTFTSIKQPYSERQIVEFHKKSMEAILQAFTITFEGLRIFHPGLADLVEEFRKKQMNEIEALLILYVNRHEDTIENVTKAILMRMLEAEVEYDEKMSQFTQSYDVNEFTVKNYHLYLLPEYEGTLKSKLGEAHIDFSE
ncbi:unnamed protein product, partial [Allacma fusca]